MVERQFLGFFLSTGFPSPREWSGGATVLGKLPMPGCPTNLDYIVRQGPTTVLTVGAGGGCLDIFLSSIISLFFLPLSERRPDID